MYFVCYFLQMESKLVENEGAYSSMGENYEKRLSEQQTAQKKQSIKFQEQETSLLDQLASTKKTLISLSEEFNKGKKLSEEHRDKIQRLETNIAQAGSDKDVLETKLQENLAEINMFQQKISSLSQELDDMEKHIRDLSVFDAETRR
jgi:chromosome segregation ATPase